MADDFEIRFILEGIDPEDKEFNDTLEAFLTFRVQLPSFSSFKKGKGKVLSANGLTLRPGGGNTLQYPDGWTSIAEDFSPRNVTFENLLSADKAAWITTILSSIDFNLQTMTVVATLTDQSEVLIDLEETDASEKNACLSRLSAIAELVGREWTAVSDAITPKHVSDAIMYVYAMEQNPHHPPFCTQILADMDKTPILKARSHIRAALLDAYTRFVLPILKQSLPETFGLWKLNERIEEIKSELLRKSGELAKIIRKEMPRPASPLQRWCHIAKGRLLIDSDDSPDTACSSSPIRKNDLHSRSFGMLDYNGQIALTPDDPFAALDDDELPSGSTASLSSDSDCTQDGDFEIDLDPSSEVEKRSPEALDKSIIREASALCAVESFPLLPDQLPARSIVQGFSKSNRSRFQRLIIDMQIGIPQLEEALQDFEHMLTEHEAEKQRDKISIYRESLDTSDNPSPPPVLASRRRKRKVVKRKPSPSPFKKKSMRIPASPYKNPAHKVPLFPPRNIASLTETAERALVKTHELYKAEQDREDEDADVSEQVFGERRKRSNVHARPFGNKGRSVNIASIRRTPGNRRKYGANDSAVTLQKDENARPVPFEINLPDLPMPFSDSDIYSDPVAAKPVHSRRSLSRSQSLVSVDDDDPNRRINSDHINDAEMSLASEVGENEPDEEDEDVEGAKMLTEEDSVMTAFDDSDLREDAPLATSEDGDEIWLTPPAFSMYEQLDQTINGSCPLDDDEQVFDDIDVKHVMAWLTDSEVNGLEVQGLKDE